MAGASSNDTEAFVTLATNDEYALGALVLAHSLKASGTTRQLVCMITNSVTDSIKTNLAGVFNHLEVVDIFDSKDEFNLSLLKRPDLGITFTKINCWRLTQYTKCVFLDADTLVVQNIDDLFEREELSAAPDPGWPDMFNSGVFVYKPSKETFASLVELAVTEGSFDGGDQGLLNLYFSDWATKDISRHLPFTYNCTRTAFYTYAPALRHFASKVRVAHFIGAKKPWHHVVDQNTGFVCSTSVSSDCCSDASFLNLWWNLFLTRVRPTLNCGMQGLCGQLAKLEVSPAPLNLGPQCPTQPSLSGPAQKSQEAASIERQSAWERGEIDYTGNDSFSNIQSKLDKSLNQ